MRPCKPEPTRQTKKGTPIGRTEPQRQTDCPHAGLRLFVGLAEEANEQQFLKALDDKLWKAADKLRANLDAANYKHVVLGPDLSEIRVRRL